MQTALPIADFVMMKSTYNHLISLGALVALIGYVLSGPVAFLVVQYVSPQPPWNSPATFAENYSTIQDIPFYFGFLLIGGMLMLSAGHYLQYNEGDQMVKFHLLVALGWTIVFCALISFNYISQITFVRHLALNYKPEHDAAIFTFSMSNPLSFCWANEMWGYAVLGIATWLMAGFYKNRKNIIRLLLIVNGIVSLLSAAGTIIDVKWLLTTFGLIAYFAWNMLMITIMSLVFIESKKQES